MRRDPVGATPRGPSSPARRGAAYAAPLTAALLATAAAGPTLVRVRFSTRWAVASGEASVHAGAGGWTDVDVCRPGEVRLQLQLLPADHDTC